MTGQKTAIVTGAGSGVGRAAAGMLAEAGFAVVLVSRRRDRLDDTARMIRGADSGAAEALVLPADLTEPDAAGQLVAESLERYGRIDAVANVAGFAPMQPVDQITPQLWRQTIDTNLSAPVLLTAAVWPTFRKQQSGVIVNVSSMASIEPFPGFNAYAAAKAGLNVFTKCTADEGARIGVRAVCIAPGAIETPMLRDLFDTDAIGQDKTLDPTAVAAVIRGCITGARQFEPGETILLPSPA